jgi:hypothetical protein
MKTHFTGLAVAALLVIGPTLAFAEDPATTPTPPAAETATPKPDAPPPSVPRPSIVPKTAEPAATPAATEAAPRHRRYAHRHWHRWGYYHTAYWEPFPFYWPHFHHNRIHWSRIPWLFNF